MRSAPDLSWLIYIPWYWILAGCAALAITVGLAANAIHEQRARKAWRLRTLPVLREEVAKVTQLFDQAAADVAVFAPCTSCGVAEEDCEPPVFCCVVCRYATRTHPVRFRKETL